MKIKGIPVGTTMPRPDWNQDNPQRADYIKNKPTDLLHGTDATLSVSGKAADAKAVGDAIAEAKNKTKTDETLTASGVAADAYATGERIAEIEETIAGMGLTATDDGTGVVTLQFSSEGGGGSGGGGSGGGGGGSDVDLSNYYTINEVDTKLADKISQSVAVVSSTPATLYGVDSGGNPKQFRAGAGSDNMQHKVAYYSGYGTLKSAPPINYDDVVTVGYGANEYARANPMEAQEAPVFLNGSDTSGYSKFSASNEPKALAVPYFDEEGVLKSATREGWYEDDVVTYGGLRHFNTYPLYLVREPVGDSGAEESYVFYNDEGDRANFNEISGRCYDGYRLCVVHDETVPDYRQIVGMRYTSDPECIYFGNNEYKMTPDGVITRLSEPKMELLHSATIPEEGLAYIDLTNLKLDAVTLIINSPATTTQGKARLQVYYNGTCFYRGGDVTASDTQSRAYGHTQEVWKRNGAWRYEFAHQVAGWGIAKYTDTQGKALLESDYPYIERVLVYFTTMPANAKIDIYGVKRNEN